jgi:hypothetical protein
MIKRLYAQAPIYAGLSAGLLLCICLLVTGAARPIYHPPPILFPKEISHAPGLDLAQRLERSEIAFQRSKGRRHELHDKYPGVPEPYPTNHPGGWPGARAANFHP